MAADGVIKGVFFGQSVSFLNTLIANTQQAILDVMTTGQHYSVTGRTFTAADLQSLNQTIAEAQAALNQASGTRIRRTLGYGGGFTR